MGCKINNSNPPICWNLQTKQQRPRTKTISFSSTTTDSQIQYKESKLYTVNFKTLIACKLGIASYPDFEYNAVGDHGIVDLDFKAKFWFSVGSIYKAPPLVVETVLTSEESKGKMRSGKGERLDEQGNCKLVGVATVDPIDDIFVNTFRGLPTECLAGMNAVISLSPA